jgi:hypothetical protein
MSEFYDDLASVSLDLLTEFGQVVVLRQFTMGSENTTTGVVDLGTPTDINAVGILEDYVYRRFGDTVDQGTLVMGSDKKLVIYCTVRPTTKDHIIVDGNEYDIVTIKSTNPAGTPLIYELWISR